MSTSEVTDKFLNEHAIRIIDRNKRAHKRKRVNVDYFEFADNYDMLRSGVTHKLETEPLYTVEIAESELNRLAEFENNVFNNMKQQGHYNVFETLMEQKREEIYLRETYPAVKKLFEQYSMMLSLAKSGQIQGK